MVKTETWLVRIIILQTALVLIIGISWCVNAYKLTQCDFEAPYKQEIIHTVGLIPPAAVITVWFGTEEKDNE